MADHDPLVVAFVAVNRLVLETTDLLRNHFPSINASPNFYERTGLMFSLIQVAASHDHPITTSEISRFLRVSRSSVSRHLKELEDRDLIYATKAGYVINHDAIHARISTDFLERLQANVRRTDRMLANLLKAAACSGR